RQTKLGQPVPETLAGTARRPSSIESRSQDRRRSGRQSRLPSPLSCARPRPIDRTRNAGTRWRATAKRLLPAAFLPPSPTIDRLDLYSRDLREPQKSYPSAPTV